jgi:hypothetical protein
MAPYSFTVPPIIQHGPFPTLGVTSGQQTRSVDTNFHPLPWFLGVTNCARCILVAAYLSVCLSTCLLACCLCRPVLSICLSVCMYSFPLPVCRVRCVSVCRSGGLAAGLSVRVYDVDELDITFNCCPIVMWYLCSLISLWCHVDVMLCTAAADGGHGDVLMEDITQWTGVHGQAPPDSGVLSVLLFPGPRSVLASEFISCKHVRVCNVRVCTCVRVRVSVSVWLVMRVFLRVRIKSCTLSRVCMCMRVCVCDCLRVRHACVYVCL